MKKEYEIATTKGKQTIQGEPIILPGYEKFEFFVHHSIGFNFREEKSWRVSEVITGFSMGGTQATRKAAIVGAGRTLAMNNNARSKIEDAIKTAQGVGI